MDDRGLLLGSDGKFDNTVTWSNMEIENVPDELHEIAKVISRQSNESTIWLLLTAYDKNARWKGWA